MSKDPRRSLFSAERTLVRRRGPAGDTSSVSAEEVLGAIDELKSVIEKSMAPPETFPEINVLKGQLHEMRESIEKTKREIAAVRQPGAGDDRLTNAAMELDAIVQATETATHEILNATEEIEERVQKLRDRVGDVGALDILGEISGLTIKILEACNFQDISGQRTGKVVKIINYLEERITTMIDIWGAEEFTDVEVAEEEKDEDAKLLEGPQLKDQGVSQAEIDAMFD